MTWNPLIDVVRSCRPDIWNAFQDRFAIPEVGEFYGSTEGNISLINHATTLADRGAVGRQGWFLRRLFGGRIVKFDVEKEEPVRDKNGPCPQVHHGRAVKLANPVPGGSVSAANGHRVLHRVRAGRGGGTAGPDHRLTDEPL